MRFIALTVMILFAGCGVMSNRPDDNTLFATANSQLTAAQKAGAEEFAKIEFEDARNLLSLAEDALKKKDKEAKIIIQRAYAKARLAEVLARQEKAETEAAQAEVELKASEQNADKVRIERQSIEAELNQLNQGSQ